MYRVRQIPYYISEGPVWLYLSSENEISYSHFQVTLYIKLTKHYLLLMIPYSQRINITFTNALTVTIVVKKIALHHNMMQYQYEGGDSNYKVLM